MIGTITPNNYAMPFEAVKCWLALKGREFYSYSGSTLYHNRNMVFAEAKRRNEDLIFIDSDIVFTTEDVEKLEGYMKEYDMVTGVYALFDKPEAVAVFERIEGDYAYTKPQGIQRIGACGMGFCAISKRVIRALPDEPFNPLQEGEIQHGEDVSFCHRVNLAGFGIWCDSSIKVGQVRAHITYPL